MAYDVVLGRIAEALEKLASCVDENGVFQMRDVDRAQVYQTHLGENLRPNG